MFILFKEKIMVIKSAAKDLYAAIYKLTTTLTDKRPF